MTDAATYRERRLRLSEAVGGQPIALLGHKLLPRNFAANHYPFRQDSSFLYFTGVTAPDAALVIDTGGLSTLFLPEPHADDALWHGELPLPEASAAAAGIEGVEQRDRLDIDGCLSLPVADPTADAEPSMALVDAVIDLRIRRDAGELDAMRRVLDVTAEAHGAAMSATRPGVTDTAIQALIEGIFSLSGMGQAYGSIVTARGEVLHGHSSGEELRDGELLLVDAGAEGRDGYASDITRTWPVSGSFTPRQRDVYEAVLASQLAAIDAVRSGVRYRDIHLAAARVLTRALVDLGLLVGDVDSLLERGAQAVFFPHGVGHLIGLDAHDMELYGDRVGYPAGRSRPEQFGLSFLRLDRDMEPGMVVTIEPGLYFVPAILHDEATRARFGDSVSWARAESWLPFGGIRIEDDVLVTDGAPEVLGPGIPKAPDEVEALVGIGRSPRERLLNG